MTNPVNRPDGAQIWYKDGCYHREDGPAYIEHDGTEYWFLNGELHREDGPAVISPHGTHMWFSKGSWQNNKKKFREASGLSDEDMTALLLKYNFT